MQMQYVCLDSGSALRDVRNDGCCYFGFQSFFHAGGTCESISTKQIRHGLPDVLTQAWLVRLLHHDVAGLHVDLRVVEQHVDLAFQHDGVVDRAGAVREGVTLVALRRRVDAHLLEDFVMVDALDVR